jgi:hypothetical protein
LQFNEPSKDLTVLSHLWQGFIHYNRYNPSCQGREQLGNLESLRQLGGQDQNEFQR